MNHVLTNQMPTRIFMGTPQTDKIQVFKVSNGRCAVISKATLTNLTEEDAWMTLTVNAIDVIRKLIVAAGETKFLDLYIVLNDGDSVSLQQETDNAINVTLNGVSS